MYTSLMDIYDSLTERRTRFLRVDELCRRAAERRPDLLPDAAALAAEAPRMLREKEGAEKRQGAFLAEVLADPQAGLHLCHAMLLPRADSAACAAGYEKTGELDLPGAHLARRGKASILTLRN